MARRGIGASARQFLTHAEHEAVHIELRLFNLNHLVVTLWPGMMVKSKIYSPHERVASVHRAGWQSWPF
jgi:hypothetical protein